jgi:hypothetical protein
MTWGLGQSFVTISFLFGVIPTWHAVLINRSDPSPVAGPSLRGLPLMRRYVSRVEGVASVRRAYVPEEMRKILLSDEDTGKVEVFWQYLFRMG